MKLRCTPNSIRLRVRKSDLELLQKDGAVFAAIQFGAGIQFGYALKLGQVAQPQAEFNNHQVTITLPLGTAQTWINSEQVTIECHQTFEDGQTLHLLIEKDFPCRHTDEADLKDTFFELAPNNDPAC
jgi:hypothetical protein